MNKLVWIVTTGSYDSYRIEGVFSTREKADAYAKVRIANKDGNDICAVKFPLDPDLPEYQDGLVVWMDESGNVRRIDPKTNVRVDLYGFVTFTYEKSDRFLCYFANTPDEQTAIKITNEMRTLFITYNVWGDHKKAVALLKSKGMAGWRGDSE